MMPDLAPLTKEFQPYEVWEAVLDRAALGKHPSPEELAAIVEGYGVDDIARAYVASRLRGGASFGNSGRPPTPSLSVARASHLWQLVLLQAERLRREGIRRGSKRMALEMVARAQDVEPESLRRSIRRGLKGAPPEHREWLKLFEEGIARDPDEQIASLLEVFRLPATHLPGPG
ncbi:MAG: hypothetical protein VW362_10685, partial [Candidatus Nanopelagicales bacterium]